ncbi:MAG: glycerophosphodiester phosphodiesterase [Myxococcales bacterium]|nr:glycerophosphodiester phosphodiesterase [Myxococcales bacterium]
MRWVGAGALAVFLLGCGDDPKEDTPKGCNPSKDRLLSCAPLLIAHRGGGALMPEETLPAFDNASTIGADVLELDVHSTADDEIVCLHDDEVNRTTDGTGLVHDFTLAELRKLDAGYAFTQDQGATHPWRGKGVTIPTLAEVLDAHPTAWWSIEIKQTTPGIVDLVLAVLDEEGAAPRSVLVSFSDDVVQEVRAKRPNQLTGMGLGEMLELSTVSDETEADYTPATRLVQPPYASLDAALVARANRLGLVLHAWTVNDETDMNALLDLGVHGIMTDDPALLKTVIDAR